MRALALRCALASVQGGLAALAVLAVCAILRRLRAPSRVLCWLWLAAGLRFLLPGIRVTLPRPHSAPLARAADTVQAMTAPVTAAVQTAPLPAPLCRRRPCPQAPPRPGIHKSRYGTFWPPCGRRGCWRWPCGPL